jgi:hypothetical protein
MVLNGHDTGVLKIGAGRIPVTSLSPGKGTSESPLTATGSSGLCAKSTRTM